MNHLDCRIFITRHGETLCNKSNIIQGRQNVPLNEKGKEQAHQKAIQFKNNSIEYIVTSPLTRTIETASLISEDLGISDFMICEDLIARSYGPWEGEMIQTINEKYQELLKNMREWSLDKIYSISPLEEIESYEKVSKRVFDVFRSMLSKYPNQNGLFITHGGVITSLLLALQIDSKEIPLISQDGYVELSYSDDQFHLENVVGLFQPIQSGNQNEPYQRVISF
jgi:broad specificity phosphatase PhoE